jgi:hypothetical protein
MRGAVLRSIMVQLSSIMSRKHAEPIDKTGNMKKRKSKKGNKYRFCVAQHAHEGVPTSLKVWWQGFSKLRQKSIENMSLKVEYKTNKINKTK